ncbi:MAG TPA: hypothetical protein RMH99_29830 [Sandaracinaceae bacterium LLY-WYZ-13_1]|nr:hypothetical protein [Sandaracinaceae bacterium LLY-WYZ-13_1]
MRRWAAIGALASAVLAGGCASHWAVAGNVHRRVSSSGRVGVAVPLESGRGRVAEAPSLAGVEVRCARCAEGQEVVTTDASGFFLVDLGDERPVAPVRLTFSKPGYRTVTVVALPTEPIGQTIPAPIAVLLEPEEPPSPEAQAPPSDGTPPSERDATSQQ